MKKSGIELLSDLEIKKAKQEASKKNHPDRVAEMDTEFQKLANERMKEINRAFEEAEKSLRMGNRTSKGRRQ